MDHGKAGVEENRRGEKSRKEKRTESIMRASGLRAALGLGLVTSSLVVWPVLVTVAVT